MQIEFYFSVENLCKDIYLRSHMGPSGWTPIALVADFPRVRRLGASVAEIASALAESEIVEVDFEGQHVRVRSEDRESWTRIPEQLPVGGQGFVMAASAPPFVPHSALVM